MAGGNHGLSARCLEEMDGEELVCKVVKFLKSEKIQSKTPVEVFI